METVLFPILAALGGFLMVVGAIYLGTAFVVAVQVCSFAVFRLVKIPKLIVSAKRRLIFSETDLWAEEHGFHYVGLYRFQVVFAAVWENPERSTLLIQYLNFEGPFFDIATGFDKEISLSTGNVRDGILMPFPPWNYIQIFPKKSLEELWGLHLEADGQRIDTLIEEFLANAVDEEQQLDPLMKLLVFQIDAGRFAAAEATVQRRAKMKYREHRFAVNLLDFQTRLATDLAEAGRIDDAINILKNIRDFESLHAWRAVIQAEAKAGRFDDAVKHLPHCKRPPSYRDEVVAEIATAQIEQGRLAEAEKTLDLFKAVPRKVGVAVSLAEAYLAAGNNAEAVKWTDRLTPLMNQYWEISSWNAPKPELFSRIAILEAKIGRSPDARNTAQRISLRSGDLRTKTLATIGDLQADAEKHDDGEKN